MRIEYKFAHLLWKCLLEFHMRIMYGCLSKQTYTRTHSMRMIVIFKKKKEKFRISNGVRWQSRFKHIFAFLIILIPQHNSNSVCKLIMPTMNIQTNGLKWKEADTHQKKTVYFSPFISFIIQCLFVSCAVCEFFCFLPRFR